MAPRTSRPGALAGAATAAGLVAALLASTGGPVAAAPPTPARGEISAEAPLFRVVTDGMSPARADDLAAAAGIKAALARDGRFSYTDAARYGKVPSRTGRTGRDEDGRRTVARSLDLRALRAVKVLDDDRAVSLARELLQLPAGFEAQPRVGHTRLDLSDRSGRRVQGFDLDTTVTFDLTLAGRRVVGPGNRNRIAFAGDGSVISLNQSLREVDQAGWVGIIGPESARAECARLYGRGADQLTPELVYSSPALSTTVRPQYLLPHYACRPASGVRADRLAVGRLVPAAPELTPEVRLSASSDGAEVSADLEVSGGRAPYDVRWSSSSTRLKATGTDVSYRLRGRGGSDGGEGLSVTVTDANGVVSTAAITLPADGGSAETVGLGGAGGAFAVGIEQTVDEWQCAQDSANGFSAQMRSHDTAVRFDWRGANAWETDFKKTSAGGSDSGWVDSVDAQWYTGHGSPGGFTFKDTAHADGDLTPADARWGDNVDLEWMQLESCQVLADTNGTHDYFQRWAPAFDGLHLLNGFHTDAQCVGGGTGARFASYLFPTWWGRPGLTVPQAWQAMADELEPNGTVWRSVSPARAGWVHNLGDHFWGQGSVGPDIRLSQQIGWVSLTGTV